jgi:hypothetical protein
MLMIHEALCFGSKLKKHCCVQIKYGRPVSDELDQYGSGPFQSVELMEDIPWVSYSETIPVRDTGAYLGKSLY